MATNKSLTSYLIMLFRKKVTVMTLTSVVLIAVAFFRELFGFGSIYGAQVITNQIYIGGYENNGLMILSPGAFFILGLIVWAHRAYTGTADKD